MTARQVKRIVFSKQNRPFVLGILAVLLLATVFIASIKPERSVTAFCTAYKLENAMLAKGSGTTYSVKPFTHSSSSPRDFVIALDQLEIHAPNDIQPDVKALKQIFEKIDKDPSQALSASLSGLSAESSVSDYANQHCK